jgi:uroporphyrinogen decarboxylase
LSLLDEDRRQDYIPAGFFIHFDRVYHKGRAGIDKHMEFFKYTDMDFVKIQYEKLFPRQAEIAGPDDWSKMPLYKRDFFESQLDIVGGLVAEAKNEALVIMTLYSPFMCAAQATSYQMITEQIKQNPAKVKKGIEIVTDSLMVFVKECVKLGIDGFYTSTQGGESFRFEDRALFNECVRPFDLALMEEIDRSCGFNILHVCDYNGGYDDLAVFTDYPGHVINCSQEVGSEKISGQEISRMFGRPFMGGLDRKGVVATGDKDDIKAAVKDVLDQAPEKFILGADCTLPNDVDWDNIKTAIEAAHEYKRN